MSTRRRWLVPFSTALASVLLGIGWIHFAPVQFGGQASYVMIAGASMEPVLHRGDLVVVHTRDEYEVGDIVTYRHPVVGAVIHRIIERDMNQYIFKGDNNSWIDSYQPTKAELIGKAWIHVPGGARLIRFLRTPHMMALQAVLIGIFVMTTLTKDQNGGGPGRVLRSLKGWMHPSSDFGEETQILIMVLSIVALASLVLALSAFTKPYSRIVTDEITYENMGSFEYSAEVPLGVYDSGKIETGESIFQRLTDTVSVRFRYRLLAEQIGAVHGTYRMLAEVSDVDGWKRTVELQPETAFHMTSFITNGKLDLEVIQGFIDNMESMTGLNRSQYTLAVIPDVKVSGTIAGQDFEGRFSPRLEFRYDEIQLALIRSDVLDPETDPLKPFQMGVQSYFRSELTTLSILGLKLSVWNARWISGVGLALSLAGLILIGFSLRRVARESEAAGIRLKYGSMMVTVENGAYARRKGVIQVSTVDDLARLAEKTDRMIHHEVRDSSHHYYVSDGDALYHYQCDEPVSTASESDEVATPREASDTAPVKKRKGGRKG